jgi:hypothetical protein
MNQPTTNPLTQLDGLPNFAGDDPLRQLVVAEILGARQCVCVTGEEWLRRTFDPALRTSKPTERLAAQRIAAIGGG